MKRCDLMKKIVKNFRTGDTAPYPACKCITWIQHWSVNRNKEAAYCSCCGINSRSLVGGHVIVVGGDNSRFIVPLCYECNSTYNTKSFEVDETDLIPANKEKCINK